jgi:hypothetical protein
MPVSEPLFLSVPLAFSLSLSLTMAHSPSTCAVATRLTVSLISGPLAIYTESQAQTADFPLPAPPPLLLEKSPSKECPE